MSNITHEFRMGEVPGDNQCLYSSVVFGFDRSQMTNIKSLRKEVADVIRNPPNTDDNSLLLGTNCQTREVYCREIEEGTKSGSEPERRALAYLYTDILLCFISKINSKENEFTVSIDIYIKDVSSYKKCIIIFHDEASNAYIPLYLYDKTNHEEEKTNFKYTDAVKKLLSEFIQNKLNYHGHVNLDIRNQSYEVNEQSRVESEFIDLSYKIGANTSKNPPIKQKSKKRKICENDDYQLNDNTTQKSTSPTNNDNMQSSVSSHSIPPQDQIHTIHKKDDVSMDIIELIQTDPFPSLDPAVLHTMNQQYLEAPSIILSTDTNAFHSEQSQQQMKFETEPITEFRARELSDYIPKSETKRDGTRSERRKCSYFADMNNRHYFNLLIPTMFLFGDLRRVRVEVCMVTSIIDGCIYIHPYFQFYIHRNNMQPCIINPFFIDLGYDNDYKLKKYQDNIQSLILHLPVIMLKNDELLQNQPIQPFQLLGSNGQVNTRKYDKVDTYKDAFHLNKLRFAITLWVKESHDTEYRRRTDLQYISQISTQNKNFKVSEWQKKN